MSGTSFVVNSMRRSTARACVLALALVGFATAQSDAATRAKFAQEPGAVALASSPEITRAELESIVRALASDEMQGRATGSPGGERAASYLAHILAATGVEPGGDDGTFLQVVKLRRTRAKGEPALTFTTHSGESVAAVYGRDFTAALEPAKCENLPIYFVREERDLANASPASNALFIDASPSKREDWLKRSGHPRGAGFALVLQGGSATPGEASKLSGDSSPLARTRGTSPQPPWIRLRGPLLRRLRDGAFASISYSFDVEEELVTAHNVIGWIRGVGTPEHPDLAAEAVVVTAHYDHLGERVAKADGTPPAVLPATPSALPPTDADPDRIYNGADDDASGCAVVLEVAGAFAAGAKPARSLVFLLVTGEEIGLLGTEEYLDRPLVPLERTVANLNFEMVGRPDAKVGGAGVMWLTAHELTNLGPAFVAAGFNVRPDPRPEQNFFERSDNFAFVRRGVVGQSFSSFDLHKDYHGVDDEADRLDYAHLEACARTAFGALQLIADGRLRPSWKQTGAAPARGH